MRKTHKNLYFKTLKKNYNCFLFKVIIFIIYENIFYIFFWYYCSIFCIVYSNSSISWLIGIIESIIFQMILPFLLCIILSFLKYSSIRFENEVIFTISKLFEIFL